MKIDDTIVALATPSGTGAIGVIRVSGKQAILIADAVFQAKNKKALVDLPSHSVHLGQIFDDEQIVDEALATLFKGHKSYTGEPTVEFSCHGSHYILQKVIELLILKGCRAAEAGEFTMRAFLNGKMDLSQAEAVSDLIASENKASHQLAMQQMRGGFTNEINQLRQELLDFASLIELELDFSEEDVEFANRDQFRQLVQNIQKQLTYLIDSFAVGNVLKKGIPVAIVGEPNVGKSTLLNALVNEERAIVSDIAGTTRDSIEDEISIKGIGFRFIDTAGIRATEDQIEALGIKKTYEKIKQSQLILRLIDTPKLFDNGQLNNVELEQIKNEIDQLASQFGDQPVLVVINKIDTLTDQQKEMIKAQFPEALFIAASQKQGIDKLQNQLIANVNSGLLNNNEAIVTNSRHYSALQNALEEINKVQEGLNARISGDLLAVDIRQALYNFGLITGQVTNDELLGNIFSNFCIGK
jgi:tRNA modification GTPase